MTAGYKCPSCRKKSVVLETRAIPGSVRRSRKCTSIECGFRFSTYEVLRTHSAPLKDGLTDASIIPTYKLRALADLVASLVTPDPRRVPITEHDYLW